MVTARLTQFYTIFDPPPTIVRFFYYWGLSTVVTTFIIPSPRDRDVIYWRPLRPHFNYLKDYSKYWIDIFFTRWGPRRRRRSTWGRAWTTTSTTPLSSNGGAWRSGPSLTTTHLSLVSHKWRHYCHGIEYKHNQIIKLDVSNWAKVISYHTWPKVMTLTGCFYLVFFNKWDLWKGITLGRRKH